MKHRYRCKTILPVSVISLLALSAVLTACNQSFDPFQENNKYIYSIQGYLDASADTQWVRIMPVRDTFFLSPEPIDAVVSLEHLTDGGDYTILKDSLFYYGNNAYAWNFWTTMNLEPTQTYLLTVQRSDGEISTVTVTLPDDYPIPVIDIDPDQRQEYLKISGVNNLAGIHSNHQIRGKQSMNNFLYTFSHLQDTVQTFPQRGEYIVQLNPSEATSYMETVYNNGPFQVLLREVFIASAGSDWPYFPKVDEDIITLPDGISNVENGVGFVAGIVSKTISWEMACFDFEGEFPITFPCSF